MTQAKRPLQRLLQCALCDYKQAGDPLAPPSCPQHPERVLVAQRWLLSGPKDYLLGAQLGGKYRLLHPLGQGQFGKVYHAQQEGAAGVQRSVAVKILRQDRSEMHALFLDEVKVVSQLKGVHIAQYLDSGFDQRQGLIYLVMELIEGETLAYELDERGAFEPERALELISQLLIALEEAHASKVVHRDLKPANMMISRQSGEEVLKVLDFGISRPNAEQPREQTQGLLPGTPAYMAPELFGSYTGEVTPQMDLFSVGVLLYQLIMGSLPFEVEGDVDSLIGYYKLYSQRPKTPRLPQLDRRLEQIVQRALAIDPKRRFQSARELLIALSPWSLTASRHVGDQAHEVDVPSTGRSKHLLWLSVAAVLGGALGLAVHSAKLKEAAQEPSSPQLSAPQTPTQGGVSTQTP